MPAAGSAAALPSSGKYPLPGWPSVRAMARVTKSYVTRAPRAGEASAIALRPSLRRRAVHDPRQIRDGGLGVELGMDVVTARVVRQPADQRRPAIHDLKHTS